MRDEEALAATVVFCSYGTSTDTWRRGGVLCREMNYLEMLGDRCGPVALISYGSESDCNDHGRLRRGQVRVLGNRFRLPAAVYSLLAPVLHWRTLRRAKAIRAYQLRGAWTAALASVLYRKPFVLRTGYVWSQFHAACGRPGFRNRLVLLLERFALKCADKVVVSSQEDRETLARLHGVRERSLHVVPNPVDTGRFSSRMPHSPLPGRVIFVGRLELQKRVDLLIDAIAAIPGAGLVIVGEGSLRKQLEVRADGQPVEFKGVVPNEQLPDFLRQSQVFVMPSEYEGSSKALLEAMAIGLPVVACRVAGNASLIKHQVTGLLCDPTPIDLSRELTRLLGDGKLRRRLGAAAAEYVKMHHSVDVAADAESRLIAASTGSQISHARNAVTPRNAEHGERIDGSPLQEDSLRQVRAEKW